MLRVRHFLPSGVRVVAARKLGGALHQMSDAQTLRYEIPVIKRPEELVGHRRQELGRVAGPAGHHDVRAAPQSFNDEWRALIGLGPYELVAESRGGLARLNHNRVNLFDEVEDSVGQEINDFDPFDSEIPADFLDQTNRSLQVRAASIVDNLDPVFDTRRKYGPQLRLEKYVVADTASRFPFGGFDVLFFGLRIKD